MIQVQQRIQNGEKKKILKSKYSNMITEKIAMVFSILMSVFLYSQEIISDFNNDKIDDKLAYKCYKVGEVKDINEPTCRVILRLGKLEKSYSFDLTYVYSPVISSCGSGCILLFDASPDTEYTQEFTYFKKYNNWILTKDQTLYKDDNGKIVNNLPEKYFLSIDNKKYPMGRASEKVCKKKKPNETKK